MVLLGCLTCIGPLSVSFYLPALPEIAADFRVPASQAQLTMTATLAGLAVGQLVLGSLSDAVGRRIPLLTGLGAYSVVSFAIVAVDDVAALVVLRGLQGFFGCAGIVLSRAVVRDTATGPWIGRLNARLLLVITVTPLVAPTLGAQVLAFGSWRTMFTLLGGLGCGLVILAKLWLPETLAPERRRRGGLAAVTRTYAALLRDRQVGALLLVAGLTMGAYFTYVTASPFVFQGVFGLSNRTFALLFGAGALTMIAGTQLAGHLFGRVRTGRVAVAAFAVGLAGSGAMGLSGSGAMPAGSPASGGLGPLVAALLVTLVAIGTLVATSQGLALSVPGPDAGSRAALLGAAQFGIGAAAAPLSGLLGGTAVAMAGVMAGALLGAALAYRLTAGRR